MDTRIIKVLLALGLLSSASLAQPAASPPDAPGTSLQFFDCEDAYWIHKGFNDTMFQVNSGDANEAYSEEASETTRLLIKRLRMPRADLEIIYLGQHFDDGLPALRWSDRRVVKRSEVIR